MLLFTMTPRTSVVLRADARVAVVSLTVVEIAHARTSVVTWITRTWIYRHYNETIQNISKTIFQERLNK